MANTAYSKKFKRELDPLQLLSLLNYKLDNSNLISNLPEEIRTFIRQDIICPCCKATNTEIVSDSISANGKSSKRQPHFRFKDTSQGTKNGHHPFCDTIPSPKGTDSASNVFTSKRSRSRTTKYIRRLVCTARQINFLTDSDIANFRQWVFDLKKDNYLENKVNEKQLVNAYNLRVQFHLLDNLPPYLDLEEHRKHREHMKPSKDFFSACDYKQISLSSISKLAKKTTYLDVEEIKKFFYIVNELSKHVSGISYYFQKNESKNLVEAFLCLFLFKNNWDIKITTHEISQLHDKQRYLEIDESLGNITGSNPFQNIMAYDYLKKVNSNPILIPDDYEIKYSFKDP
jgi:hypothetical protein